MSNENEDDRKFLKRFDMYRFFSRTDVILAILFILAVLVLVLYITLSWEPVV